MASDDGGPAFPRPDWSGSWAGPYTFSGMTLRDWFAGHVLAGKLPTETFTMEVGFDEDAEAVRERWRAELAQFCYVMADAMLEARKVKHDGAR